MINGCPSPQNYLEWCTSLSVFFFLLNAFMYIHEGERADREMKKRIKEFEERGD